MLPSHKSPGRYTHPNPHLHPCTRAHSNCTFGDVEQSSSLVSHPAAGLGMSLSRWRMGLGASALFQGCAKSSRTCRRATTCPLVLCPRLCPKCSLAAAGCRCGNSSRASISGMDQATSSLPRLDTHLCRSVSLCTESASPQSSQSISSCTEKCSPIILSCVGMVEILAS